MTKLRTLSPCQGHPAKTPRAAALVGLGHIEVNVLYRRRAKARQQAALALEPSRQRELFDRAEYLAADLARDLARCAAIHAVMPRELAAAFAPG
jgi:hypothetical protein